MSIYFITEPNIVLCLLFIPTFFESEPRSAAEPGTLTHFLSCLMKPDTSIHAAAFMFPTTARGSDYLQIISSVWKFDGLIISCVTAQIRPHLPQSERKSENPQCEDTLTKTHINNDTQETHTHAHMTQGSSQVFLSVCESPRHL